LLHQPTHFELDGPLFRNFDRLKRLGVLSLARFANLGLKDTEVSEFQAVAFAELVDDLVQELLNDPFYLNATLRRVISDSINQFFLGDGGHSALEWF